MNTSNGADTSDTATAEHINPADDRKGRAMRLLVEGHSLASVAELVGASRPTVRAWRESPEGQRMLRAAREECDREFKDSTSEARELLKSLARRAVQVLEEDLDSEDADIRHKAARTVLDRVGLPRTERVETITRAEDLSKLSDDELETLRAIRAKIEA